MKDLEYDDAEVIDLGQATVETKGAAGFEIDVSNGKLNYLTGIAED